MHKPKFTILEGEYTIHRFDNMDTIPDDVYRSDFYWIGKTSEELSIVCSASIKFNSPKNENGWKVLKLLGPFALNSVGILSGVSGLLAGEGISIFALSTYDTDYILIKESSVFKVVDIMQQSGYILCS